MIEADGVERFFTEAFELPFPEFPEVRFRAFLDRSFRESSEGSSVEACSFFFTSSLLLDLHLFEISFYAFLRYPDPVRHPDQ